MSEKRPLAVILTALSVEFKAVRLMLENISKKPRNVCGIRYTLGEFKTDESVIVDIALAPVGKGNKKALLATQNAMQHFNPDCIFFVGVAGGIKSVKIGDVVAADRVYEYETAKIEETIKARPEVEKSQGDMVGLATFVANNDEWLERIDRPLLTSELVKIGGDYTCLCPTNPNAIVAPIAAGSKVVASGSSEVNQLFDNSYNDALAVEMEGAGFLSAILQYPEFPAIVIRGISDLLDGKTKSDNSGSQEIASAHAAAFAFELLHQFFPSQESAEKQLIQEEPSSSDGTKIPITEFDKTIQFHINELFQANDFQKVRNRIIELAEQEQTASIGELLCSPDIEIESALGWLNQAAAEIVQAMPKDVAGEQRRDTFKGTAKEILGWLVLRTVKSTWEERPELLEEQMARLQMRKYSDSGIEIIIARNFKDRGRFEGNSEGVQGVTALNSLVTEGGIEPKENQDALFRQIYKQICRDDTAGAIEDAERKRLSVRLKSHALSGLRYYLTVPLDHLADSLKEDVFYAFQEQFPYLKLILLRLDGESALLVDDDELHELILTFFFRVIEEQA